MNEVEELKKEFDKDIIVLTEALQEVKENQKILQEEFKKGINRVQTDINTVANYVAEFEKEIIKINKEQDNDVKSLENDVIKEIRKHTEKLYKNLEEILNSHNGSNENLDYIKALVSDDSIERQKSILEQVKKFIKG